MTDNRSAIAARTEEKPDDNIRYETKPEASPNIPYKTKPEASTNIRYKTKPEASTKPKDLIIRTDYNYARG